MKRLFGIICLCLGTIAFTNAQSEMVDVTQEDYERFVENSLQMEFRNFVLGELDLTSEQIIKLDPVIDEYMEERSELFERKFRLLDEYAAEMAEDDLPSDEKVETMNFVDNYWFVEIREIELKQNFFDKIVNVISPAKSIEFFLLEEMLEDRMKQQTLVGTFPILVEIEKMPEMSMRQRMKKQKHHQKEMKSYSQKEHKAMRMEETGEQYRMYRSSIEDFQVWAAVNKHGVDLSHEYTHDGLTKMTHAVNALAKAHQIDAKGFAPKKKAVLRIADQLTKNPLSTQHADLTQEAFNNLNEMLNTIQMSSDSWRTVDNVGKLRMISNELNPEELMTDQAEVIYNYFDEAHEVVKIMSANIDWDEHTGMEVYENK